MVYQENNQNDEVIVAEPNRSASWQANKLVLIVMCCLSGVIAAGFCTGGVPGPSCRSQAWKCSRWVQRSIMYAGSCGTVTVVILEDKKSIDSERALSFAPLLVL